MPHAHDCHPHYLPPPARNAIRTRYHTLPCVSPARRRTTAPGLALAGHAACLTPRWHNVNTPQLRDCRCYAPVVSLSLIPRHPPATRQRRGGTPGAAHHAPPSIAITFFAAADTPLRIRACVTPAILHIHAVSCGVQVACRLRHGVVMICSGWTVEEQWTWCGMSSSACDVSVEVVMDGVFIPIIPVTLV